jgi:NADH dehydrogenase
MQSRLHKIVVVGGGSGGLELVTQLGKSLGKKRLALPTLVDGSPTHVWKPLLHEVATGSLNTGEDELNYFSHGHTSNYEFQYGWMNGLDRVKKRIHIGPITDFDGRNVSGPREVPYDTLVLSVGGLSHSFGIPGVDKYCNCLDTPEHAEKLRRKILGQALSVVLGSTPSGKLRIGIVGGGATGVELAAQIHHTICELRHYGANLFQEQLQMTIMEGGPRLLGGSPESLSNFAIKELRKRNIDVRTDCMIKSVNERGFEMQDGSVLETEIKVWTAGIKAPEWLKTLGLKTDKLNRIIVNENLQSVDDSSIFALGDCACAPWKGPNQYLPATAQVAHQQSTYLVRRFKARLNNQDCPPFLFKPQGILVSLGEGKAVGSLASIVGPKRDYYVEGRGAKALYSSLYRMHQAVLYGWTRAGLLWIGDKLRHVALPQLKLH